MRKNKRMNALLLAALTALSLSACAGSGGGAASSGAPASSASPSSGAAAPASSAAAAPTEIVNNCNPEGLPIVAEPITLVTGVNAPSSAYQGDWDKLDWIKQLQEQSGITFDFRVYNSPEEKNLVFTSRDYPDIMFGVANDTQVQEAMLGGDIYQLDELIAKYSPNWSQYLAENDIARKTFTLSDGHIWSIPMVRDEPSNGGLRDQWLINKSWLDELGLSVPTTTAEFHDVLKAFKDNAGKGSIPENVIPYYIYRVTMNIGGALDLINSFGLRITNERGLITVDDSGKVEFNAANPDIKEPLSFIHQLFEEGLIAPECLTDDWDTYLTKTRSDPPIVGSYHSYQNPDASNTKIVAMGPLDSGNGKSPLIRSQTNQYNRNSLVIFKNNAYPEATMRLADLIADPDWSIQAMYGMFGDTYLTKNDDGSVTMLPYEADAQGATSCPMNKVPFLLTSEMFENFTYAEGSAQRQRADAIENLYAKCAIPASNLYPNLIYTEEQNTRNAELQKDLMDYVAETFSNWALNGGIEEGWDAYTAKLNQLGLEEWLQLRQQALDAFNAN